MNPMNSYSPTAVQANQEPRARPQLDEYRCKYKPPKLKVSGLTKQGHSPIQMKEADIYEPTHISVNKKYSVTPINETQIGNISIDFKNINLKTNPQNIIRRQRKVQSNQLMKESVATSRVITENAVSKKEESKLKFIKTPIRVNDKINNPSYSQLNKSTKQPNNATCKVTTEHIASQKTKIKFKSLKDNLRGLKEEKETPSQSNLPMKQYNTTTCKRGTESVTSKNKECKFLKGNFGDKKNNMNSYGQKNKRRNRKQSYLQNLLDCVTTLLENDNEKSVMKVKPMFLNYEIDPKDNGALIADIINIVNQIVSSDSKFKTDILQLMSSQQLLKSLQLYIIQSAKECSKTEDKKKACESFFQNLIKLFKFSIELLSKKHLLVMKPVLILSKSILERVTNRVSIDVEYSTFSDMCLLIDKKKDTIIKEGSVSESDTIENRIVSNEEINEMKVMSVFPTKNDLFGKPPEIRKNIIEGAYKNVDHYLTVQFNLLHEDFVAPLRKGIADYLSPSSHIGKKSGIAIYQHVKILHASVDSGKLGHVIKLDRKVNWSVVSSYFIYGSLILFTTNNFEDFFSGTVIKVNINNRTIVVKLDETHYNVCENIYAQEFTMAASKVFFEPYFHVLSALQKIDEDTFPMEKYIVQVNPEPKCPAYVTELKTATYNIFGTKNVNILDSSWPELSSVQFNTSQLRAFQAALTSEFVAIQGPPGTGKTFLGLQIAKTLIDVNVGTPILVVCYKNHALDQFLEGILGKTKKIVRIGGRSKNMNLEKYNLKNIRRNSQYSYKAHESVLSSLVDCYKAKQNHIDRLKVTGIVSTDSILPHIPYANIREEIKGSGIDEWLMEGVYMDQEDLFDESYDTLDENADYNGQISNVNEDNVGNCNNLSLDHLNTNDHLEENVKRLEQVYIDDFDYTDVNSRISEEEQTCDVSDNIIERVPKFSVTIGDLIQGSYMYEGMIRTILDDNTLDKHEKQLYVSSWKNYIDDLGARIKFLNIMVPKKFNLNSEQIDKLYKASQTSIWSLTTRQRWMLYDSWLTDLAKSIKLEMIQLEKVIRSEEQELDNARSKVDLAILQNSDVVGVTTTGAAKLRPMLNQLGAKIVVIEEAAEVLESHIVTALSSSCQHVILIGDHKQLRPSPAVYQLCTKYHLDVSLFERMVKNGLHCYQLSVQHRMRPEFASLIVPDIYPQLSNHSSTEDRPDILGVHTNLFFINHNHDEEKLVDSTTHVNRYEAKYVVEFARYLLLQGYQEEDITILATYVGQVRQIIKERQKILPVYRDLRISTVDDFQGEESKIILLSLVRSNNDNKIGFLKTENRVCVALTRARDGFFIIGNMDMMSENAEIWSKVKNTLIQQNALGSSLSIYCQNHPDTVLAVNEGGMFGCIPEGGCRRRCAAVLTCGHVCTYHCHPRDQEHQAKYVCSSPCERILCERNHCCPKTCAEKCSSCMVPVVYTLSCGHDKTAPCSRDPASLECQVEVPCELPSCGHQALRWCCESEQRTFLRQGCHQVCDKSLPCGHKCQEKCHTSYDEYHESLCKMKGKSYSNRSRDCICNIPIEITLPCEHKMKTKCHQVYPDTKKKAFISTTTCAKIVDRTLPCGHVLPVECSKLTEQVPCLVMVTRTLACGHRREQQCSTPAGLCEHPCARTLPCGHTCQQLCSQLCKCTQLVKKQMTCGHEVEALCGSSALKLCEKRCERVRPCGHVCQDKCGYPCDSKPCPQIVEFSATSACGHKPVKVPCHVAQKVDVDANVLVQYCQATCNALLKCGHRCPGCCKNCHEEGHAECDQPCSKILPCGHRCVAQCKEECAPCYEACQNLCSHSKCEGCCGEPCPPCKELCTLGCMHTRCTRPCFTICNRWPCNLACPETLACGHPCAGFCGELCPPLCPQCQPALAVPLTSRLILLEDCGHTVEARKLDLIFKSNPTYMVKCPLDSCGKAIVSTKRYRNYVKKTFRHLVRTKKQTEAKKNFKFYRPIQDNEYSWPHQLSDMHRGRYQRNTRFRGNGRRGPGRTFL